MGERAFYFGALVQQKLAHNFTVNCDLWSAKSSPAAVTRGVAVHCHRFRCKGKGMSSRSHPYLRVVTTCYEMTKQYSHSPSSIALSRGKGCVYWDSVYLLAIVCWNHGVKGQGSGKFPSGKWKILSKTSRISPEWCLMEFLKYYLTTLCCCFHWIECKVRMQMCLWIWCWFCQAFTSLTDFISLHIRSQNASRCLMHEHLSSKLNPGQCDHRQSVREHCSLPSTKPEKCWKHLKFKNRSIEFLKFACEDLWCLDCFNMPVASGKMQRQKAPNSLPSAWLVATGYNLDSIFFVVANTAHRLCCPSEQCLPNSARGPAWSNSTQMLRNTDET